MQRKRSIIIIIYSLDSNYNPQSFAFPANISTMLSLKLKNYFVN